MKFKAPLEFTLVFASLLTYSSVAFSEAHKTEQKNPQVQQRGTSPKYAPAPRSVPMPYQAHPAGVHPHGPIVRPHATRVLGPRAVAYGSHQWQHWNHAEFARPAYYWDWNSVHNVTCVAEDSYGDQYPVTEAAFPGSACLT